MAKSHDRYSENTKGLRWLLFKHSSNRSKRDTRILNSLSKGNRRIHRAWVLKDEFEQFWDYKYVLTSTPQRGKTTYSALGNPDIAILFSLVMRPNYVWCPQNSITTLFEVSLATAPMPLV